MVAHHGPRHGPAAYVLRWLPRSSAAKVVLALVLVAAYFSMHYVVAQAYRLTIQRQLTKFKTYRDRHRFWAETNLVSKADAVELLKELWPNDKFPERSPEVVPELLDAPWLKSWETPVLQRPAKDANVLALKTPALVMLHIFSAPTRKGAERRAFIRKHHPLTSIPRGYRHLVEVKFVIGYPPAEHDGTTWQTQDEVRREQAQHGDLAQLEGLEDGENMNKGKTMQWVQWVGRGGSGRETLWALKIDDDAMPLLPNLIPEFERLGVTEPAYVGTGMGGWPGYYHYCSGFTYGFSYHVLKTVGAAKLTRKFIIRNDHEDARTGEMLLSLPSKPNYPYVNYECFRSATCTPEQRKDVEEALFRNLPAHTWEHPPNRDFRTTLRFVDWGPRLNDYGMVWTHNFYDALGWHGFKQADEYAAAYAQVRDDFKTLGREYLWKPPRSMKGLYWAEEPDWDEQRGMWLM